MPQRVYPPGNDHISHPSWHFWVDDFPFIKVGYVCSILFPGGYLWYQLPNFQPAAISCFCILGSRRCYRPSGEGAKTSGCLGAAFLPVDSDESPCDLVGNEKKPREEKESMMIKQAICIWTFALHLRSWCNRAMHCRFYSAKCLRGWLSGTTNTFREQNFKSKTKHRQNQITRYDSSDWASYDSA